MSYKEVELKDYEYILSIAENDKERVLFKENINEDYSHDELGGIKKMPDIVVQAINSEEISKVIFSFYFY